jgi:DNA-binding transcriptional regulator YiaG
MLNAPDRLDRALADLDLDLTFDGLAPAEREAAAALFERALAARGDREARDRRELATRIFAARRAAELTQEQLGNEIGVRGKDISRWESTRDPRTPSPENRRLLATVLDVPPGYFFPESEVWP